MFHSTLPLGAPDLMRASEFRRYLDELAQAAVAQGGGAHFGDLSESLMQDLLRFEQGGRHGDLLEVLAACMRHTESLAVHLQWGDRVLTLTVFPTDRLVHSAVPIEQVVADRPTTLAVLQVERATFRPPGGAVTSLVGEDATYRPLSRALWSIAMHGPREELLHEISGQAAYRVVPGLDLSGLDRSAAVAQCIRRLRRQTCNLREICTMPGIDRPLATRLLNALYLQSGLIVSRTHPAATNEGWLGYR